MSSLLFLIQLSGFVLIAHWAYVNDRARPNDAGKGILRMRGESVPNPDKSRNRIAHWRQTTSRADAAASKAAPGRPLGQGQPRWKRPLR